MAEAEGSPDVNDTLADAIAKFSGPIIENLEKRDNNGSGLFGKKVFYACSKCGKEVWAYEAFAGTTCWECTLGRNAADKISTKSNNVVEKTDPGFLGRRNRFITMPNGYLLKPVSTLKHSNYKVLQDSVYDNVNNITNNIIINLLNKYYSINKKCIYLWTLDCPIYKDLGWILENDDYWKLKDFMPLIKSIKLFINNNNLLSNKISYRGSHIVKKQFNLLKINNIYRITKFLATTESNEVANNFQSKGGYKIIFNIHKNCLNAAVISKLSEFKTEDEILLIPYTPIEIIRIENQTKTIEVIVLDDKNIGQDVPSIVL